MSIIYQVGDTSPLKHTATRFQLFATARSPGIRTASISTSPMHAKRVTLVWPCTPTFGPHSPCALSPRGSAPTGGSRTSPTGCASPSTRPPILAYTARVTAAEGDTMTLELFEQHSSGDVGFEGTAWVSKTPGATP